MANENIKKTLNKAAFTALGLGSIKPSGWLREQLQLQAQGLTGHLSDVWEDVGPNNGWVGGSGDSWERGPYYLDGLLPLAYLLDDEQLISQVRPWIEWAIQSQQESGQFGPRENLDWWPRMVMLKVLTQYAEATDDVRIIPFMQRYFRYQLENLPLNPLSDWGEARGGENILAIQWLWERTGETFLLELIDLIHKQTTDWSGIFSNFPYWRYQESFDHRTHVVNVAMGLKEPALYYLNSGAGVYSKASAKGIDSLMTYHGQVNGMFSGDEWLAGTHPSQGVELCAVVEYMYTLEQLFRVLGDNRYADILEKVAFNALPATISPNWHSHQYDQQVNQVVCNIARRNWTLNGDDSNLFGLEPNFGCCTANMHQGWPKFVAHLWMRTANGLCVVSYSPCTISTQVHDVEVKLQVETTYPFSQQVDVLVDVSQSVPFEIKFRIPEWASNPIITINSCKMDLEVTNGFMTVNRTWTTGDRVQIHLPMLPSVISRANGAIGVQCGPLVYALPIQERWQKLKGEEPYCDWEIYPESPWNYALVLNPERAEDTFKFDAAPLVSQPFSPSNAPTRIIVKGKRVPEWGMTRNSASTPPISPVKTTFPEEELVLLPYGSVRLRIAEFPIAEEK